LRTVLDLPADWSKVIDVSIHPTRIEIVSALDWIDEPLSPAQLVSVLGSAKTLSHVGYHVRKLVDDGILMLVDLKPGRSSMQHFYALSAPRP
jgi:hypothetical protein